MKHLFSFILLIFSCFELSAQLIAREDSLAVDSLNKVINLSEIVVHARNKNIDSRGLGNMRINMKQLRVSPLFFGERDIIKTLQFLPGVSAGMEGSSQLNIRGGTNDQTLYLMDDVPVYNQNHTFGFFSMFNSDALQSADIYKGGIPSVYGDRLSGVAAISLKDGDFNQYKHSLSLGLLAGTAASEGPILKDKLSYLFTARRSFLDLLYNGVMALASEGGEGMAMIAFYDVNGKLSWKINPKSKLSWQIYTGYDDMYGLNKVSKDYEKYSEKAGFGWKTTMTSLRFTSQLNPGLFLSSTLYYTQLNNFNNFKSEMNYEGVKNTLENNTSSLLHEIGWRNSLEHKLNDATTLTYGLEATRQIYTPNYMYKIINSNKTTYDAAGLKLHTVSASVYDEYRYQDWLFSAGIRAALYNNTEKTKFVVEPRLKINRYIGEKNKLMLAYDRMHQPVHSINEMNYNVRQDFWIPFNETILPTSQQISLGWKNYTTRDLTFSVEAYWKQMENLIMIKNMENYLDFHSDYETGKGKSMGAELMVEYSKNKINAWLSYTLSQSKRQFEGKFYPFKYDAPHDISAFGSYIIRQKGKNVNTLSLNLQYKTGYPYYVPEVGYPSMGLSALPDAYDMINNAGVIDYIPAYPNVRLKNYFRTDINFTMEQPMKHGSRTWQFSLLNATARQNPYAVYKKDGKYKAFVLIPFLPSISFTRNF
ncbi:TonB-dependent receptor [Bacteroidia bacterium]|nr:TonB-dependent receptor [Bacteroidia bacterium]